MSAFGYIVVHFLAFADVAWIIELWFETQLIFTLKAIVLAAQPVSNTIFAPYCTIKYQWIQMSEA